jgi:hypothetical protein
MNTIGNLGGAAAGFVTGWVLDWFARSGPAEEALQRGWTANFQLFTAVYVLATLFWLQFDSTKPVVPEKA